MMFENLSKNTENREVSLWGRFREALSSYPVLFGVAILLAVVGALTKYYGDAYNNFSIFCGVFDHLVAQTPLYAEYANEYFDVNHYGPSFGPVIAPFAVLPRGVGLLLWMVVSVGGLFWALRYLPLERKQFAILILFWLLVWDLYTAIANMQYNILITAFIIGSFVLVERKKDFWATLLIALGGFSKIIGFGALTFFLFSKDKKTFLLSMFFWSVVVFGVPILISDLDFVITGYKDWFHGLSLKSISNMFSDYQNISLIGMIRKISGDASYSDLPIIIVGLLLFAAPLLRFKQYANERFRMATLASVCNFIVLFSNGSESSSYVLAFSGVLIWYFSTPTSTPRLNTGLLIFAFLLTSVSLTDVVPTFIRMEYIRPYALKALPCVIIWLKVVGEMLICDYAKDPQPVKKTQSPLL